MNAWTIDEACRDLGIARRTLQYHLRKYKCPMISGRYLITQDIMEKLKKRNKKPGRKKVKKDLIL